MKSKWVKIVSKQSEKERGRLDLCGKGISESDIPDIIEACQGVKNQIKEIDLGYNNIGAEGAKYLSTANFPNLTKLDLEKNNIGAEAAKYLSIANFPNLTELRLKYNNIQQPNKTYLRLLFEQKNIQNVGL